MSEQKQPRRNAGGAPIDGIDDLLMDCGPADAKQAREMIGELIEAEREVCAKIAEDHAQALPAYADKYICDQIARAIRARREDGRVHLPAGAVSVSRIADGAVPVSRLADGAVSEFNDGEK